MVGVGPGDPELITVAAQRAIAAATVVAYPVAALERPGMAAQIAQVQADGGYQTVDAISLGPDHPQR